MIFIKTYHVRPTRYARMPTFHILVNPFIPTKAGGEHNCDAFNAFAKRLAKALDTLNHVVYFYGTASSPFSSTTRVIHLQMMEDGDYDNLSLNRGVYLCHNDDEETKTRKHTLLLKYHNNTKVAVEQNAKRGDFVLYCYTDNPFLLANPNLIHVMPNNMGAKYLFTPYNIFPSTSWAHWMLAEHTTKYPQSQLILKNFLGNPELDTWEIVPPLFEETDFTFNQYKNNNEILYLARIQACKGILTVLDLAYLFPSKTFLIAGDTSDSPPGTVLIQDSNKLVSIPSNVKLLGYQNTEQRAKLLGRVSCLLQPSPYPEPFGFNVIESYLSGTPVITTNFGTFTETVKEGETGFKCRTLKDFENAINAIHTIKPERCYLEGIRYTSTLLRERYNSAFKTFWTHWNNKNNYEI